jgi:hypothetical protein
MIISVFLVLVAVGTLAFFLFRKDNGAVPVEKQFIPIIFNDQTTFLEVSGLKKDDIEQTVLNEVRATKTDVGGVEGIYLTLNKQVVGLRQFIALIKGNFVPGDNALFVNDNFLMGSVLTGLKADSPTDGDFFILLKMRSTADIFDSLHAWEGNMFSDLHGFLGIDINGDTNYLLTKGFEDGIIENKNARILYDNSGKIVLMYIFADDNSVIVTGSQNAVHEIMLRLASGQTKQ